MWCTENKRGLKQVKRALKQKKGFNNKINVRSKKKTKARSNKITNARSNKSARPTNTIKRALEKNARSN